MTPTFHTLSEEDTVRFLSSLWHLNRRMKHNISPLMEIHGLDMRRFFILLNIRKGTVYPKELSEKLQIPSTLLSRYIDQLVKQGLLERHIDEQDSRRIRLSITTDGQATYQTIVTAIKAHTSERLQHLAPEQLFPMLNAMETLGEDQTNPHPTPQENNT